MKKVNNCRTMKILIFLTIVFNDCWRTSRGTFIDKDEELYMSTCRRDLGMSSGAIVDRLLSASSSYDEKSVGPISSRIRQEKNGGAWCPKLPISKEMYEWLQIDLEELKVISLVETQGRFGNGQGQEFAPNYMLEYQRENGTRWIRYRDKKGNEVIKGNSNTYIAELRELRPPIIARNIRFIPWSNHPRMMCMRVELYGCQWTDGVVSYGMRQGDKRGPELDLGDATYDGRVRDGYLSDGLGQLTDWEEGTTNFRLDQSGHGRKGFEWVGWKNETNLTAAALATLPPPPEIVFRFDRLRNVSAIRIHANNFFTKDVAVFRRVLVYFSVDGAGFRDGATPLRFDYAKDGLIEAARTVVVPVPHRIGRSVKLVFFFELRWIMISEVRFESEPIDDNFSFDENDFYENVTVVHIFSSLSSSPPSLLSPSPKSHAANSSQSNVPRKYSVIPLEQESTKTVVAIRIDDDDEAGFPNPLVDADVRNERLLNDASIGIIVGVLATFVVIAGVVAAVVAFRHRRNEYGRAALKSVLTADRINFKSLPTTSTSNGKVVSKGNVYKSIATNESSAATNDDGCRCCEKNAANEVVKMSMFSMRGEDYGENDVPIYELPIAASANSCCSELANRNCDVVRNFNRRSLDFDDVVGNCRNDAQRHASLAFLPSPRNPDQTRPLTLVPPLPPRRPVCPPRPQTRGENVGALSGTSVRSSASAQGPKGTRLSSAVHDDDVVFPEFRRQDLMFIEKLGEGHFSEVYLCETTAADASNLGDIADSEEDDDISSRDKHSRETILVKMLRPHATDENRLEFQKEMKTFAQFKDPNIVSLLGVCSTAVDGVGQPASFVLEYMRHGDLHQFLLNRVAENTVTGSKHQQCLSYGSLIYMATQIASGMKYLENMKVVHRDLAARNCLVGHRYGIKIMDLRMSRFAYSDDYYEMNGSGLVPIRWTAWEAVLLHRYSCQSDVWSFGVTLWEILGMARCRPYDSLADEQVLDECQRFRLLGGGGGGGVSDHLCRPTGCPKEIYDLIKECWNGSENKRPTFREIHMFLHQKNAGYDPRDQQQQNHSISM